MSNKRIDWIDIAKFISIFFVMLSHFELCPGYLRAFFAPFYLSVFFFCSGYCYKGGQDFKTFLSKKIRTLVWPWFLYSNLNIFLSHLKSFKHHENGFLIEVFHNLLQIRFFDERLWFIPALFTAFIPFYFLIRYYAKSGNKKVVLMICAFLCLVRKVYKAYMDPNLFPWKLTSLPWHIDYIPTALLFLVLGYLFKEDWESKFDAFFDLKNTVILVMVYLLFVYYDHFNGYTLPLYIDYFYDHIRHILSILMIVRIAKWISPNCFLLYIGRNTLIYFCIHNKAVTLSESLWKMFLPEIYAQFGGPVRSTIYCFVMTLFICVVLLVPAWIINKYFPWTLGKTRAKQAEFK